MIAVSPHRAAISKALASFATLYGSRFTVGSGALDIWASTLSDLTPQEVEDAVRLWTNTEKWPPTPADLRGLIPRFCRCGRCWPCRHRAVKRAQLSSPGADLDSGETLDEQRRRFFGRPAERPALPNSQPLKLGGS